MNFYLSSILGSALRTKSLLWTYGFTPRIILPKIIRSKSRPYSQMNWSNLSVLDFPFKSEPGNDDRLAKRINTKPPNIFGRISTNALSSPSSGQESFQLSYDSLLQRIRCSVDPEIYTVYSISPTDFQTDVWQESTEIFVLVDPCISNSTTIKQSAKICDEKERINAFLRRNGKVLLVLAHGSDKIPSTSLPISLIGLLDNLSASFHPILPIEVKVDANECYEWRHFYPEGVPSRPLLSLFRRECHNGTVPGNMPEFTPSMIVTTLAEIEKSPEILSSSLSSLGARLKSPTLSLVEGHSPTPFHAFSPDPKSRDTADLLQCLFQSTEQPFHIAKSLEELPEGFAWREYFAKLETEILGRTPVWADVLESSFVTCQKILTRLPLASGLMVTSSVQTGGIGRRENHWISPRGLAPFTLHFNLPYNSINDGKLSNGQLLSWMQHLASLAVLLSLRQLVAESLGINWSFPNSSTIEKQMKLCDIALPGPQIFIKWPNDVYVVEGPFEAFSGATCCLSSNPHVVFRKIGGVLLRVNCSSNKKFSCICGIGINVANQKPTICLHDVIRAAGMASGIAESSLNLPSIAAVIAYTNNHLERLIKLIESHNPDGLKRIIEMYTACWFHKDQKVTIQRNPDAPDNNANELNSQFTIDGVDEYGYLRVVDTSGHTQVLHPNGNSLDMLAGLIIPRSTIFVTKTLPTTPCHVH